MGTPKLAGHTVQGTLGSPVWYTGLASLLGNAPVVITSILQEVMFMRYFTTGNLLVVFSWCQTSLRRLEFWKHTEAHGAERATFRAQIEGRTCRTLPPRVPPNGQNHVQKSSSTSIITSQTFCFVLQPRVRLFGYCHTYHSTSQFQGTKLVCRGKTQTGDLLYWARSLLIIYLSTRSPVTTRTSRLHLGIHSGTGRLP